MGPYGPQPGPGPNPALGLAMDLGLAMEASAELEFIGLSSLVIQCPHTKNKRIRGQEPKKGKHTGNKRKIPRKILGKPMFTYFFGFLKYF